MDPAEAIARLEEAAFRYGSQMGRIPPALTQPHRARLQAAREALHEALCLPAPQEPEWLRAMADPPPPRVPS